MNAYSNWLDELRATCEDLLGDAILLRALERYDQSPDTTLLPRDLLPDIHRRLTDYLLQHAQELDCRTRAAWQI